MGTQNNTFGNYVAGKPSLLAQKKESLAKILIPCLALFFRSENQAKGKFPIVEHMKLKDPNAPKENSFAATPVISYSTVETRTINIIKKDRDYIGNFGFDTYCPRLYGTKRRDNENKETKVYEMNNAVTVTYKKITEISGIIDGESVDRENFDLKKNGDPNYYASWISIMKGKEANITIKLFSTKIETKEKIDNVEFKLVLLTEDFHALKNTENPLFYKNYHENALQIINGNTMEVKKDVAYGNLTLRANEEFDIHIGLIAFYTNSNQQEIILGQSIVVPNRALKINLKFFKIKICDINNNIKYTENHPVNVTSIIEYLNNKSLNQACVEVVVPNPTIDIIKIKENYNGENGMSRTLAQLYEETDLKTKPIVQIAFDNRAKILALKDDVAEGRFASYIVDKFKETIKEKMNSSPLFEAMYAKHKNNWARNNERNFFLEVILDIYSANFIPIFLCEDVTCAIKKDNSGGWTEAFESGTINGHEKKIFISKYNLMQKDLDYNTYAHELAHALSVNHTFDHQNGLGLLRENEGQTLENIMDYFKVPVDTDNKLVVQSDKANCFIYDQWKKMKEYYETRKINETESYDSTVNDEHKDVFKTECQRLFNSL